MRFTLGVRAGEKATRSGRDRESAARGPAGSTRLCYTSVKSALMIKTELGAAEQGPDQFAASVGPRPAAALLQVPPHQDNLFRPRSPGEDRQVRPAGDGRVVLQLRQRFHQVAVGQELGLDIGAVGQE